MAGENTCPIVNAQTFHNIQNLVIKHQLDNVTVNQDGGKPENATFGGAGAIKFTAETFGLFIILLTIFIYWKDQTKQACVPGLMQSLIKYLGTGKNENYACDLVNNEFWTSTIVPFFLFCFSALSVAVKDQFVSTAQELIKSIQALITKADGIANGEGTQLQFTINDDVLKQRTDYENFIKEFYGTCPQRRGGVPRAKKVFVLGRERVIRKKDGDRKQYVMVNKALVPLTEARKLEKSAKKPAKTESIKAKSKSNSKSKPKAKASSKKSKGKRA